MKSRRSRFAPGSFVIEALESRIALSGGAATNVAAEIAARGAKSLATKLELAVAAGTLGQPITFTATVRAAAAAGSPAGTVDISDHGAVIETLTLSPTPSPNARYAYSDATVTLTQPPGGAAYFFGKHTLTATFIPSGSFSKSAPPKPST